MKLETWAMRALVAELNLMLPKHSRWPKLKQILSDLENQIPLRSIARSGSGIFIGWIDRNDCWYYHHAVCLPECSFVNGKPYGFHGACLQSNHPLDLTPVFNVGDIPESFDFVKILNKHEIEADIYMRPLSKAKLKK